MRLLDVQSIRFVVYADERQIPSYGILSHRWQDVEISYQDLISGAALKSKAFSKIENFCRLCKKDGLSYAWIDTCCINKDSSAELSEAINSMYRWYRDATKCYVYLSDVDKTSEFAETEWYKRGWTLQELIAPNDVHFYGTRWQHLGTKLQLCGEIEAITHIPQDVLHGESPGNYSIAQRMSWAAKRITTRIEDQAYCLLGLFNVNMPMLYGEGERAFIRLQEEIIKYSADQSIFAWPGIISEYDKSEMYDVTFRRLEGLLATSPSAFQFCDNIRWEQQSDQQQSFSITNLGLSMETFLRPISVEIYEAKLNCSADSGFVSIFVRQTNQNGQYTRHSYEGSLSRQWEDDNTIKERRIRMNVVQGHQTEQDQLCQSVVILSPGPLFDQGFSDLEFSERIMITATGNMTTTARDVRMSIPFDKQADLARIKIKGSTQDTDTVVELTFGFDFSFNPYMDIDVYHGNLFSNAGCSPEETKISTEGVWDATLQRKVFVRPSSGKTGYACRFLGHRNGGILALLTDLNAVIDIQKKQLLARKYWTIDIQKAFATRPIFVLDDQRKISLLSLSKPFPLTDTIIGSLLFDDDANANDNMLSECDICPICQDLLCVPLSTACAHKFCQSCFRWANIFTASTDLASLPVNGDENGDGKDMKQQIFCPICTSLTYSQVDFDHQKRVKQSNAYFWRYAHWKLQDIKTSEKFPVLEVLTLTIGNTHKLTEVFASHGKRANRHDWTFYIRPSRSDLIANVRVHLHQSFRENVLDFPNPPFEVRRFGWGTFEILAEITLKSQYSFFHDKAVREDDTGRSKLEVSWTLNFSVDDDQGWLKLIIGRSKPKTTAHDERLLAEYARLRSFQIPSRK